MPGRRGAAPIDKTLCRRCQEQPPTITVRNDPLCAACFTRYVSTKVVKRMEAFRVTPAQAQTERMLLIPLSFGYSSISLLYVLSQHLKGQRERSGRTGYKLHILHVQEDAESQPASLLVKVQARFPEHTYSTIPLSSVLDVEDVSALIASDGQAADENDSTTQDRLTALLNRIDSTTSRADLLKILKRKLVTSFARSNNCEAILWGDTTTRLAERTLAETAKGRGFSLPQAIGEGSTQSGIPSYYPMRDLLGKEVASFTSFVDPPLDAMVFPEQARPVVNLKNTTIDDLMRQYFESAEQEYPSIVTNVVRTTAKLDAHLLAELEMSCELCEMPLSDSAPEKSRLCYGCIRTLPQRNPG